MTPDRINSWNDPVHMENLLKCNLIRARILQSCHTLKRKRWLHHQFKKEVEMLEFTMIRRLIKAQLIFTLLALTELKPQPISFRLLRVSLSSMKPQEIEILNVVLKVKEKGHLLLKILNICMNPDKSLQISMHIRGIHKRYFRIIEVREMFYLLESQFRT